MKHPEWRDEVLEQLDAAAELNMFPGQPNEYLALADMRMTAFRSGDEWLLTFEVVAWAIREAAFENQVQSYGNRLERPGFKVIEVVTGPGGASPWRDDDTFDLNIADPKVEVRGEPVQITPSADDLREAAVDDESMPPPAAVIRLLAWKFPGRLFLSDVELLEAAGRDGSDLQRLLQVDDWRQPDIYRSEHPSEVRCLQSLAEAIVEGDPSMYDCPASEWNTHWSNSED